MVVVVTLASVVFGRMDSKAAPAGADFNDMVLGFQRKLAADAVQLFELCIRKRRFFRQVNSGRIRHRVVEEGREQVVAEVVMLVDVAGGPVA